MRNSLPILMMTIVMMSWSVRGLALDCTVDMADMAFGDVPTLAAMPFNARSSLSYRCNASLQELATDSTVTLCVSFNSGSAAHYSSDPAGMRKLGNGAHMMLYNLYVDASRSQVWGSNFDASFGSQPPAIQVSLSPLSGVAGASGAGSRSVFGQISGQQLNLNAGMYSSHFGPGQMQVVYDFAQRLPDCKAVSGMQSQQQDSFTVSAQVSGQCSVAVSPMNFGSVNTLHKRTSATSVVAVNCVAQTPYKIGLGIGNSTEGTVAGRRMVRQGAGSASTVSYQLYQDGSYTHVWGQTLDVDTVSGIANGVLQRYTVYGAVPPQDAVAPGVYTDTVVVTVTF